MGSRGAKPSSSSRTKYPPRQLRSRKLNSRFHLAQGYRLHMPRSSPYTIRLSQEERRILEARARKYTLSYRDVFRASVILLAAQGLRNDQIAERLNTRREIVSKWRKRFFEERLEGLEERDRAGRSRIFPP